MKLPFRFAKFKENRLFIRMMFYFSTLLIPILIVGLIGYEFSTHVLKRDYSASIKRNLQSSADAIDIYINTAQETSINFFSDETVRSLVASTESHDPDAKTRIARIPTIIRNYQNILNGLFIQSMFVYWDNKRVYTSEGVDDYDFYFRNNVYQKYDEQFWYKLLGEEKNVMNLPPSNIHNQYLDYDKDVIPIVTIHRVNDLNAAMVINISVKAIMNTIVNNSIIKKTDYVVQNGEGQVIVASAPYDLDAIQKLQQHVMANKEGYSAFKLDGKQVIGTSVVSDSLGWRYYSITPVSEFNKHAHDILLITVVTCLVLLLCGSVLSLYFSMNLYSPIKTIRDVLQQTERASGERVGDKTEWDFISRRVNGLLFDNDRYRHKMEKLSNEYVDNTFVQLIRGNPIEQEEIFENLLVDAFGFVHDSYVVCCILFDFKSEFYTEIQDTDRLIILEKLRKIVWVLFEENVPTYVLEYRKNLYVCIVNIAATDDKTRIDKSIKSLLKCFEYDSYYCNLAVGIGNRYEQKRNIRKSFSDAMTAIESRKEGERFPIIHAKEIGIRYHLAAATQYETNILHCLKAGNRAGMLGVLNTILQEGRKDNVSYSDMNRLFTDLYYMGVQYAAELGRDIRQLVGDEREFLTDTHHYQGRISMLGDFFSQIIEWSFDSEDNKSGSLVAMIFQYVQANYMTDIYLDKIAAEMGVSANYISRIFKQKTAINLSDYIGAIRINKAKELLAGTNMSVDEIAQRVGIYSRSTFIRLFKKMEGITPSRYRETR